MQEKEVYVKEILDRIYDSVPESVKRLGTIHFARALYLALCLEVGYDETYRKISMEEKSELYTQTEHLTGKRQAKNFDMIY